MAKLVSNKYDNKNPLVRVFHTQQIGTPMLFLQTQELEVNFWGAKGARAGPKTGPAYSY